MPIPLPEEVSLETFTKARDLVESSDFVRAKRTAMAKLDLSVIEEPIRDIVEGFNTLEYCFTLQCCYGHFLCLPEQGPENLDPLPDGFSGLVTYRIAYLALCLENGSGGQSLLQSLARLPAIDPEFIQFGSADWFWKKWVNSYAIQVEPRAHALKDQAILEPAAARQTQKARDRLFRELRVLLAAQKP